MSPRSPVLLSCMLLMTFGLAAGQVQSADLRTVPVAAANAAQPSLLLRSSVELPGYTGDFDHFEVDLKGNRLFLAAEDHGTLEVFNLATGKHERTVGGVEVPHGLLYLEDKNRLIVTDSGAGLSKVFDTKTYKVIDTIKLKPGADSMAYDASSKHLYVASGGKDGNMADSFLSEVDPRTGKQLGELKFDTNKIEAMVIEQHGRHIYLNVTGKNYVAVIDKTKLAVVNTWPIKEAEQNAPVAFDEANHRLFIITRKPGKLVVLNSQTGASIASFKAPEHTDQVIFDEARHRIYVLGGEGYIGVFQQIDVDHYEETARIPSAVGAKTGILVPELNRLYVAVSPGEAKSGAAVLCFDLEPSALAHKVLSH